jgi:hypothetical protein
MASRRNPKLLAQGKPRTLGGSTRAWRVRLYAPEAGGTKYQVMFRAPVGDGEPWKRVLRRASSEAEARKIFVQAEAALDNEKEAPARADVRASRTIRMLGEEYLKDSVERGKQPRTLEQRESRLNARILPTIGDVPVSKWRVDESRKVMEKYPRPSSRPGDAKICEDRWPRCASSPGGWVGSTGASTPSTDWSSDAQRSSTGRQPSSSIRGYAPRRVKCGRLLPQRTSSAVPREPTH